MVLYSKGKVCFIKTRVEICSTSSTLQLMTFLDDILNFKVACLSAEVIASEVSL